MQSLPGDESQSQCRQFFKLLILILIAWLSLRISAASAETSSLASTEFDEFIVELSINRMPSDQSVVALRNQSGNWFLPREVLTAANVLTKDLMSVKHNDIAYIALDALGQYEFSFDERRMILEISLQASKFLPKFLKKNLSEEIKIPSHSSGTFINYDFLVDHINGNFGRSLYTEAGTAFQQGVAMVSGLTVDRVGYKQNLRLDTTFTRDFPDRMATFRLGDSITHSPTILGRPVRFGGLQWGRNFRTKPGLITVPVATMSGQAALPSTVDLYINDVFQSRNSVSPGPFSIISTPLVSGEGEVVLKITDIAGQQQIVSQQFYASSALLAKGLTDYSVAAGALRRNYGLRSNDYDDLFIATSWRHGISDQLTAEAAASAQQNGVMGIEGGATATFNGLGTGLVALGISQSGDGAGSQIALGFERRTNTHSFSIRTQFASSQFRQMGINADQTLDHLISLFYGYRIKEVGNIGLSYTRQQRVGSEPVTITTASITPRQTAWGNFTLSFIQSRAERTDTSINLFWSLSLGRDTNVSAFHTRPSDTPA